ncbi:MAG TPA: histidine phosphatase family protein [Candidatus Nanoarchaeia archaeon]|nr:histidine phosphatase family protein [Candidatus Nanoarchaeia archaeon]
MKLILVRHAESIANKEEKLQGQDYDTGLTPLGKEQAKKISERLRKEKIDAIYSSDLKRAVETAEEIAKPHKLKVICDKRLKEFNIGELINIKDPFSFWREYLKKETTRLGIPAHDVKTPRGESEQNHINRTKSFFEDIRRKHHGTIIVVAHGGTNKVIFGIIGHTSREEMYDIAQSNTGVNIIEIKGKGHKVHAINSINHLGYDGEIIKIFERVRDEPLHIKERLRDKDNSCWEKHRRLKVLLEKRGYKVRFIACKFRWSNQGLPKEIIDIPHDDVDYHLCLGVRIHGGGHIVDASNDSRLYHYNKWDGETSCKIAVKPDENFSYKESEEIEKSERKNFKERLKKNKRFYKALNKYFEEIRKNARKTKKTIHNCKKPCC